MKKLYEYQVDEEFAIFVLIKGADSRVAKNGKQYIALTFQDKSGQMDGKFWGATDEDVQRFTSGQIVKLAGKREVFQGVAQVKIISMRLATEADGVSVQHFMAHAPMTPAEMEEEINQFILQIIDAKMARIVRHIYAQYRQAFYQYPAAKRHHHALPGGLSYHTLSMLRIAKSLVAQYEGINPSLLYAGILLHDIGKVKELTGPVGTEYTLLGNMVGHIVLINEEITRACIELSFSDDDESVMLLRHMVLAHHGKLEYGSPVRPHLLEAELLNAIDMLDANINMIQAALDKTEAGQYTERIFALDNRAFYKPGTRLGVQPETN